MSSKHWAFFDLDGTILKTQSMFSFIYFFWTHPSVLGEVSGRQKYQLYMGHVDDLHKMNEPREVINADFYTNFKGESVARVGLIAQQWWLEMSKKKDFFSPVALRQIESYKDAGVKVVIVTGSMEACVKPIKKHLGIKYSAHTNLIHKSGQYTGETQGDIMIGEGKAKAVKVFSSQHGIDLAACTAYGDHHSDIPMLSLAGDAVALNPEMRLKRYALEKRWRILEET